MRYRESAYAAMETDPNQDKVLSLSETRARLYKRGKTGQPISYGCLVLAFEDVAGFISHFCMNDRANYGAAVIVGESRKK